MSLLGGFGRSARTRGWAVLNGMHSKALIMNIYMCKDGMLLYEA